MVKISIKSILQLSVIISLSTTMYGQEVLLAGFGSGYNSATASFPYNATSKDSSVSSATLNYFDLTTYSDSRGVWGVTNDTAATLNPSTTPYLSWTFNFTGGTTITDPTFFFTMEKLDSQTTLELRDSLDNFQSSIGSVSWASTAYKNFMFSLGDTTLSDSITFRLYAYDASSANIARNLFNVSANSTYTTGGGTFSSLMAGNTAGLLGTVNAVPEPGSMALAGIGGLAACFWYRRRS